LRQLREADRIIDTSVIEGARKALKAEQDKTRLYRQEQDRDRALLALANQHYPVREQQRKDIEQEAKSAKSDSSEPPHEIHVVTDAPMVSHFYVS
jgi:hypothetical protein